MGKNRRDHKIQLFRPRSDEKSMRDGASNVSRRCVCAISAATPFRCPRLAGICVLLKSKRVGFQGMGTALLCAYTAHPTCVADVFAQAAHSSMRGFIHLFKRKIEKPHMFGCCCLRKENSRLGLRAQGGMRHPRSPDRASTGSSSCPPLSNSCCAERRQGSTKKTLEDLFSKQISPE